MGIFRSSAQGVPVPDASTSLLRNITVQQVYKNIKPKVGGLSSSQLIYARAFDLRKNNHNGTIHDVTSALRRMRSKGAV